MNELQQKVGAIGVVPVIKLTNPTRDAGPLSDALCAGAGGQEREGEQQSRFQMLHALRLPHRMWTSMLPPSSVSSVSRCSRSSARSTSEKRRRPICRSVKSG